MWTALAMTAALSYAPAQGGELGLKNIRATMGILGAPRKDAENPELLIGDVLVLSFDIENLKMTDQGQVSYAVGLELRNKDGKLLYREEPSKETLKTINSLGGNLVPAFVATQTGTDTEPGEYTLTAIVQDRSTKPATEKTFSKKFKVLPPAFGLVRLNLTYDEDGRLPAPPLCVPGQRVVVNFFATGFERDKTTKQPHISFKMRVLDGTKPVLSKDAGGAIKDVPEKYKVIPANFPLFLNRAGKYTVELEATDEVSKKTAKQSFDLTVQELK